MKIRNFYELEYQYTGDKFLSTTIIPFSSLEYVIEKNDKLIIGYKSKRSDLVITVKNEIERFLLAYRNFLNQ